MKNKRRVAWTSIAAMLLLVVGQTQDVAGAVIAELSQGVDTVILKHPGGTLNVSLRSPRLALSDMDPVGGVSPEQVEGALASGEPVTVSYPSIPLTGGGTLEVRAYLQWSPEESILRKWAELRLNGDSPHLLKEVVLDEVPVAGRTANLDVMPPQSYPAFFPGCFAGIEFPVATTRIEGDRLVLAHAPGATLEPGKLYTTRTAVFGLAPPGREIQTFKDYIARNRPSPTGLHVNYNSWWTSSVPFTEVEILDIMGSFDKNLHQRHGVSLDTFTIDLGWSDSQSLWDISRERFPQGFADIRGATEGMGANLGLWISPTCFYSPAAVDTEWAEANGYETFMVPSPGSEVRICCLGGPRYATAFRERLVELLTRYGIRQVKLDGYGLGCPESDHGHAPGSLSSEAIAEGGIAAFDAMHKAAPDTWLEATCFGWNPSPWWLFHVNSVIGTFGDDAPHGRVPAPVYRESYTTARDYFNLQGAAYLNLPVVAQEVLGIIHQTDACFVNDAVSVILRGHAFLTMYINPKYMNERRWGDLAGCIVWARSNPVLFQHTEPILPASWQGGRAPKFTNDAQMPREPYGYVHWNEEQGIVGLRNPWIAPATVDVTIGGFEGLSAAPEGLSAVSLYPEVRLYGTNLAKGDVIKVPLAPYETLVLSVAPKQRIEGLPNASDELDGAVQVKTVKQDLARVVYEHEGDRMGTDWTTLVTPGDEGIVADIDAELTSQRGHTRLLILLEGTETPSWPAGLTCTIDGRALALRHGSSDAGWSASSIPAGSERWVFIEGDIPEGGQRLSLHLSAGTDCTRLGAWLYTTRPGGPPPDYPNALPPPEIITLGSVPLLELTDIASLPPAERRPVEIERINGVYLDALTPASSTQGWGTLQKNYSVTETPIMIGGRRFTRGLGTHAVSRIVFDLDGAYQRFLAFAGAQSGSNASITFSVLVDGKTVWESGPMTSVDETKAVDVDVRGARSLELQVGDGGNGIGADHANWAGAKLLR